MFTGIVQDIGTVESRETRGSDARLVIVADRLDLSRTAIGDSVCIQGVCLTVTSISGKTFSADVSGETLSVTTLGDLSVGSRVNLEPALRAGDSLGGHLVSGHVDGVGRVIALAEDARSLRVQLSAPAELARYVARKGSITVDGVSLTVNAVAGVQFEVNLIPHTRQVTTLGALSVGSRVNLEIDMLARYVERLMGEPR